jgi:fatty-acyl-CoA synthase
MTSHSKQEALYADFSNPTRLRSYMDIIGYFTRPQIATKSWFFPADDENVTVADLVERSRFYASALKAAGVGVGDAVGLVNRNGSDLVCLLYACWYLNAVAIPLRTSVGKLERFEDYLERCNSVCSFRLLVLDDDIAVLHLSSAMAIPTLSVTELQQQPMLPLTPAPLSAADTALIQFSSGSTGNPKGVIVTHGMMLEQLKMLDELFCTSIERGRISCYALWAPLNHDMGLFVGALSPIYHGADNILATPNYFMRNPMRWYRLLEEHGVEVAMETNTSLAKGLMAIERVVKQAPLDLKRCRIYLGAEKVSPVVVRNAYRILGPSFGGKDNLFIGYGMAENGLGVTTTLPGEIPVVRVQVHDNDSVELLPVDAAEGIQLASVGKPYRNTRIRICDDAGNTLPELVLGEIFFQSGSTTPGYINNPQITKASFQDGWFKSGDLGFIYQEELYFYARKDDLIIVNGQNIVPDDVEALVEEIPFQRPASTALFVLDMNDCGLPRLCMLAEAVGSLTENEIKQRKGEISRHAFEGLGVILNEIHFCKKGTIEKTSSGKKRRKVIKQRFIENRIEMEQGIL